MTWHFVQADALRLPLGDRCVQCVVTSPPYWGLRDYGVASAIGLESTPDEYIDKLLTVFREVRRVLRDDGTLWLNMGDSYANDGKWGGTTGGKHTQHLHGKTGIGRRQRTTGLKPKNLVGMPWRLALALQADRWILRSDIIWHKPNPMPESVRDRPTGAHEYLFLLSKKQRYFYDAEAVRGKQGANTHARHSQMVERGQQKPPRPKEGSKEANRPGYDGWRDYTPKTFIGSRNLRDVWTIPTEGYPEAHFATFPRRLVEPCIKAGTSEKGCCPECGTPWRRIVDKQRQPTRPGNRTKIKVPGGWDTGEGAHGTYHREGRGKPEYRESIEVGNRDPQRHETMTQTVGWKPGCKCQTDGPLLPCMVLDPFAGSGTTGVVAKQLDRDFIGIELNPEYIKMAYRRVSNPGPVRPMPDAKGQEVMEFDE